MTDELEQDHRKKLGSRAVVDVGERRQDFHVTHHQPAVRSSPFAAALIVAFLVESVVIDSIDNVPQMVGVRELHRIEIAQPSSITV